MCVCVCVRPFTVKTSSVWINWNAREQINDAVLKTFLSSAKSLHRYFIMKHQTFLTSYFRDNTHMTSMKIVPFSRPRSLVHLLPKFFHLNLGRPISNEHPLLYMITNQLEENIIQGWLWYVIRSFLQVGFRFQHQLINLVLLSFDFFLFIWSLTICFFVCAIA